MMGELNSRNSQSYFYHAFGCHTNHEPLLGIPFPWLTFQKLKAFAEKGVRTLAHVGGINPPDKVPYAVNQEIFRLFQLNPSLNIEEAIRKIAMRYAGQKYEEDLIEKRLLTKRMHVDRSGIVRRPHFRLTSLGLELCNYIQSYESASEEG